MGMFATISAFCENCQQEVQSQTKLPADLILQKISEGEEVCSSSELNNSILILKDCCPSCSEDVAIKIRNGLHAGRANPKEATHREGPWGRVESID